MSIHINADKGEIAELVLLPGDPLRAQFIAENYLEEAVCYNKVRNMFGFTGKYKGVPVSVQGTGMGIPSISIYVNELFNDYGVSRAIRIGTAGSLQKDVKIRDMILAEAASTDSAANVHRFNGMCFAPCANFLLLKTAYETAAKKNINTKCGSVFTTDLFYGDATDSWKLWSSYGALAVEMETAELYTLASRYGRESLSIITISDSIVTKETTTAEERQTDFTQMMEVALETIISK
ncbi:MAG: purine-nucleoside phosphorylase [Termitinemataceae bacterium]|nr:MAG: purine-nucleoside phosphorylase [Termitinemataceae bacterium]